MVYETYTPMFSEISLKVNNAIDKPKKVAVLRKHKSEALEMFLKSALDPRIEWLLPEGDVPYTPNDAPAGTEHTRLATEAKKLYRFIRGGDNVTPQFKKEQMFIQLLECLHVSEAKLICEVKDKKLHQTYKGLSANVVREAFGWDEHFMQIDLNTYPEGSRSASGIIED